MLTQFTLQLEFSLMLAAVGVFWVVAYFTRATRRLNAAALVAALVFSALNVLWDVAAYRAHWWWYPSRHQPFAPLPIYLAQDLVWGGALGLLAWRIRSRLGAHGQTTFVVVLTLIGGIRDSVAASFTKLIVFGSGFVPRLVDLACWATLLVIAQVVIRLIAGPTVRRELTRKPKKLQSGE